MSRHRSIALTAAKARFSELVDRAERGEEIVISRNGKPVARLAPLPRPPARRRLGDLAGRIKVAKDLSLPPEIVDAFFAGAARRP